MIDTRIKNLSREHDDLILSWSSRVENGESMYAIARSEGRNPGVVVRALNAVRKEDAAHDPEAAMWWGSDAV